MRSPCCLYVCVSTLNNPGRATRRTEQCDMTPEGNVRHGVFYTLRVVSSNIQ
jgi:hypothetical protein